jgi:hypothetical protein
MKSQIVSLKSIGIGMVVCLFASMLFIQQQSVANGQDKQARPRFEYKVLFEQDLLQLATKDRPGIEGALNHLGEDGWDLVSISSDILPNPKVVIVGGPPQRENRFYFKRQK